MRDQEISTFVPGVVFDFDEIRQNEMNDEARKRTKEWSRALKSSLGAATALKMTMFKLSRRKLYTSAPFYPPCK